MQKTWERKGLPACQIVGANLSVSSPGSHCQALEKVDERALFGDHELLSPDDNTVSASPG